MTTPNTETEAEYTKRVAPEVLDLTIETPTYVGRKDMESYEGPIVKSTWADKLSTVRPAHELGLLGHDYFAQDAVQLMDSLNKHRDTDARDRKVLLEFFYGRLERKGRTYLWEEVA